MKHIFGPILLVLVIISPGFAAKYAGESFTLGAGARPLAMGGAFTALADDATGIYYNAAGLALLDHRQISLLHSETFGALVNQDFVAYAQPRKIGSRDGALAIGIYRVGGGGILLTDLDPNTGRPFVTSEESHYDYMFLLGGGAQFSEKFRAGSAVKVILRSLAQNSAWGLGFDFGVQYGKGDGLLLGANVTNITSTFISYDNGTKESILPAVKLGASMGHKFTQVTVRAVADGDLLFEGRKSAAQIHAGSASLDTHLGVEVTCYDVVSFRVGSDIGRLAFGVGVKFNRFQIDGAFMNHQDLDNSYRVSLNVAL